MVLSHFFFLQVAFLSFSTWDPFVIYTITALMNNTNYLLLDNTELLGLCIVNAAVFSPYSSFLSSGYKTMCNSMQHVSFLLEFSAISIPCFTGVAPTEKVKPAVEFDSFYHLSWQTNRSVFILGQLCT